MRKLFLSLCVLVMGGIAHAQSTPVTMQNSASTTGNGATINLNNAGGAGAATLSVTNSAGTFSIVVEGSRDGDSFTTLLITDLSTGSTASSISAAGKYTVLAPNMTVRARISACSSCVTTVKGWPAMGFVGRSSGSGSSAPTDATFITQTSNGSLSAEQALSSLSTGIMKVTTATGVVSSITDSAGVAGAISDETGTNKLVFSDSPTLVTPTLGTPSSATLTNATGLPISTGVSGLGTGVATFLGTPSSTNLAAAVTGETGTGALVFGTSPSLTTPTLGAALATSLNGNTFTTGTYTLTGASGKVLTFNDNVTLASDGTGTRTLNVAAGGTLGSNAFTSTAYAPLASPTFTGTVALPTSVTVNGNAQTFPASAATLARTDAGQTFTGVQVMTSPTLITPAIGVATATSVNKWVFTAPTTAATLIAGGDSKTYTLPEITANIGFREITQNSKSADYTTVLTDSGKQIYHPSADTTARTWTIDSNANVAYPIGTAITFVNDTGAGVLTISITSDTLVLAGAGTTGSRTLAANGVATAIKVTSTRWVISGTGLN